MRDLATPLILGLSDSIDFWLAETQSLIAESVAVKALVDELTSEEKPFWVSFTLEDSETHRRAIVSVQEKLYSRP